MNEPTDYDGAWKETLERFLPQFLEIAFPAIHRAVDWTKTVRFLDTELQEIVRAAEAGTVRADKLVEVVRVDGSEEWLLIHAEVQTQREAAEREAGFGAVVAGVGNQCGGSGGGAAVDELVAGVAGGGGGNFP